MDLTTTRAERPFPLWLEPVGWLGQAVIGCVSYVGGVALLLLSAIGSVIRFSSEEKPAFWPSMKAELWWYLVMGAPLVGLVHVGMGSFLSLQAYFGSTFVDGTGAVVGVGLLRNLATLMAGLTLSSLYAGRIITDLVAISSRSEAALSHAQWGALAAPRVFAAAIATTLLSIWGVVVGTAVGWQCADTMMGLPYETFFMMFYQMIWFRDILGIVLKGVLFGLFPAALCCYEGFRVAASSQQPIREGSRTAALSPSDRYGGAFVRAASLSMLAILLVNMAWFLLVYHAVPIYGPSLLNPPTP